MEIIIDNEADLRNYMNRAVKASPEHPVLVDSYLTGAKCEVDAICDGKDVLLPGIMEHIERQGFQETRWLFIHHKPLVLRLLRQSWITLNDCRGFLNCIGMMNIQFVIHEEQVYVIEVNPRGFVRLLSYQSYRNSDGTACHTDGFRKTLAELGYASGLAL